MEYWNIRILEYWEYWIIGNIGNIGNIGILGILGILDYWEYWNIKLFQILEYWNIGNIGKLEFQNIKLLKILNFQIFSCKILLTSLLCSYKSSNPRVKKIFCSMKNKEPQNRR